MIYNFGDGKDNQLPYQTQASFRSNVEQDEPLTQLHNPDSSDIALADRLAREQVRVAGAHCNVFARTDNHDMDDEVWDEDADPTYFAPVILKCTFKPQPTETELQRWGLDSSSKTEAVFAMSDLVENWPNRLLRPGDVLELPYNHPVADLDPGFYRVIKATPSGNYKYHWLYFTVTIDVLSADQTVRVRDDLPINPDLRGDGSRVNGGI